MMVIMAMKTVMMVPAVMMMVLVTVMMTPCPTC